MAMINFNSGIVEQKRKNKMHSNERSIVLRPIPGLPVKAQHGLTDNRLFSNENKLLAIFDPDKRLWFMRYETGTLPVPLRQNFTSFNSLYKYIEEYFRKRNVTIKEVEDQWDSK